MPWWLPFILLAIASSSTPKRMATFLPSPPLLTGCLEALELISRFYCRLSKLGRVCAPTMLQTYLPLRVLQIFSWDLSVPACHRRWPGFCNMATSLNRTGKDHQCAPEHLFIHKSLLTVPFILVSIPIYRTISLSLVASPSCYEAI